MTGEHEEASECCGAVQRLHRIRMMHGVSTMMLGIAEFSSNGESDVDQINVQGLPLFAIMECCVPRTPESASPEVWVGGSRCPLEST